MRKIIRRSNRIDFFELQTLKRCFCFKRFAAWTSSLEFRYSNISIQKFGFQTLKLPDSVKELIYHVDKISEMTICRKARFEAATSHVKIGFLVDQTGSRFGSINLKIQNF